MRKARVFGIVLVLTAGMALSACGRKGPLEPPPEKKSDAPGAIGLVRAVA